MGVSVLIRPFDKEPVYSAPTAYFVFQTLPNQSVRCDQRTQNSSERHRIDERLRPEATER